MKTCDHCGATTMKILYFMDWYNGIARIQRWYCSACVRKGNSPPVKKVKQIGTVIKLYKGDWSDEGERND